MDFSSFPDVQLLTITRVKVTPIDVFPPLTRLFAFAHSSQEASSLFKFGEPALVAGDFKLPDATAISFSVCVCVSTSSCCVFP